VKVLVTGGSGFIGRHVVRGLTEQGHEVVVADRNEHGVVPTVQGDLTDPAVRARAVDGTLDAIVHLAAETSVLGSMQKPAWVYEVNVAATSGLLELARERECGTFVMASTNAVVGAHDGTITEDLPLRPLTPYGSTKAAAEMLLSGYAGAFGIRTPFLRLSNVYGPGMVAKDSLVPRIFRAAATGGGVQVYGDGLQRRDLVHVHDVARAFVQALESWPSGPTIVGCGTSYDVLTLLNAAREACGRPIAAEHVSAKNGEMRAVVISPGRASDLGWKAEVDLFDGLRSTWADFDPAS
jgi:UDP-glucose 4-epimerase